MKNLKKLKLLNASETKPIMGGYTCSGSNSTSDIILCSPLVGKIVECATFEANCPGSFTSSCDTKTGIVIGCPTSFSIGR